LLKLSQVATGPDKVNSEAMPKGMGMDVNADHTAIFLDDVPDLHA
jgi:hypothetical protein